MMSKPFKLVVAWIALLGLLGVIGWRVVVSYQEPGPFDPDKQGFCDFHNGVYFPALAFREGISPFGETFANRYETARAIAPHAPYLFALHVPLTWLGLRTAEFVFYGVLSIQLLLISWLCWQIAEQRTCWVKVVGLAAGMAATRAGYGTLFTGYFTFELILGALCAVHFGGRHWLGTIGFAFCCAKPTYGIPLAILMVARGQWKTVAWGTGMAGLMTVLSVAWLIKDSSIGEFLTDIKLAQENHRLDDNELPANSWTRVDALGIAAKWLRWNPENWEYLVWMLPIMLAPIWLLRQTKSSPGLQGAGNAAGLVTVLTMMTGLYRQHYDLLLLAGPLLSLGTSLVVKRIEPTDFDPNSNGGLSNWESVSRNQRWLMLTLGFLVLFNYLTAQFVMGKLHLPTFWRDLVTSINGLALLVMYGLACAWLIKIQRIIRLQRN